MRGHVVRPVIPGLLPEHRLLPAAALTQPQQTHALPASEYSVLQVAESAMHNLGKLEIIDQAHKLETKRHRYIKDRLRTCHSLVTKDHGLKIEIATNEKCQSFPRDL